MIRIIVALFLATLSSAAFAQGAAVNLNCSNSNPTGTQQWQQCPGNKNTTNSSATIATGNTFQAVLTAAKNRNSLTIENNNATDSCWITFGVLSGPTITAGNASKNSSALLLAGQAYTRYWPYVPNDEIEATCASNSDTLYIEVQ